MERRRKTRRKENYDENGHTRDDVIDGIQWS